MKSLLTSLLLSVCFLCVVAQSSEKLNNKSIVELTNAGISKKIIISKIESSECKFATDTKSLISLKKSGVDEDVVNAMVNKMSGNSSTTNSSAGTASAPDKNQNNTASVDTATSAPHVSPLAAAKAIAMLKKEGSGIYYYQSSDNTIQEIDPTVFSQQKSNHWASAWTYGFGKSTKVMSVSGSAANVQFKSKQPIFYFYFDPENNSLNKQAPSWFANVSSPNEFLLIKFETKVKNARAVTTASGNSYENAQGIDDKYKRTFKFKKLEKGIYELYFESSVESGEYGFMYAGANAINGGSSPKVYDFGVHY